MTIINELRSISKEIKEIGKKVENLSRAIEKNENSKGAKSTATKSSKNKTLRRFSVNKTPIKRSYSRLTATDIVLGTISGNKKGISVAKLIRKTCFEEKKIQNILYKAKKKGKIKRIGKGTYVSIE